MQAPPTRLPSKKKASKTPKDTNKPPPPSPVSTTHHNHCVVCFNKMDFVSLGECNHRVCCGLCSFRLRQLHHDEKCVVCKTLLPVLFIVPLNDKKSFQERNTGALWNNVPSPEIIKDEASSILIAAECQAFQHEMDQLRAMTCAPCSMTFPTRLLAERHFSSVHGTQLCTLCLDHRGLFFQEQVKRAKKQHMLHLKEEHPSCQFCLTNFYNSDLLYKHLGEAHESCHLCANKQEYFRNYDALAVHFRTRHFLCEVDECKHTKFTSVFANEVLLQNHQLRTHAMQQSNRKLNLEFTYKDSHHAFHHQKEEEEEEEHATTTTARPVLTSSDFPPLAASSSVSFPSSRRPLQSYGNRQHSSPVTTDFPPLNTSRKQSSKVSLVQPPPPTVRRVVPPPVVTMASSSSLSDFPPLGTVSSVSPPPLPPPPTTLPTATFQTSDFPALKPRVPRPNEKLSKQEVREWAFGEKKKQGRSLVPLEGKVLNGKDHKPTNAKNDRRKVLEMAVKFGV